MEPRIVWPFEILDKLGEGGMGVVFRARHVGTDRQVAVKLLPEDVAANETLAARFEREMELLKQLRHPNIVHCFGGTCESKQKFYAMELVEGGTLADVLVHKKRLPWMTVIDYALQMCAGLQHAHERGVIHRDLKPNNFLLTKAGQIKLSDFGLATMMSGSRITAAGKTLGTIQYMSPEQIRGNPPLTTRSDLYALGCVIHEMLTGAPPYMGDSPGEVLQKHLRSPIPHVAAEVLDCPLELDELVFQLLSKEAEHRPETAALVASRLEGILQPGLRASPVEPNLFTLPTPRVPPIVPLKGIRNSDHDGENRVVPRRTLAFSQLAWLAVVVLLLVTSINGWIASRATTAQLRHAEQMWVDLLDSADRPTRLLALSSLGQFGPLNRTTLERLRVTAIETGQPDDIRIAAFAALSQHAAECRSFQAEVFKVHNLDGSPAVRVQAGRTHEALKRASGHPLRTTVTMWVAILTALGGGLAGVGWLWRRLQKYA